MASCWLKRGHMDVRHRDASQRQTSTLRDSSALRQRTFSYQKTANPASLAPFVHPSTLEASPHLKDPVAISVSVTCPYSHQPRPSPTPPRKKPPMRTSLLNTSIVSSLLGPPLPSHTSVY